MNLKLIYCFTFNLTEPHIFNRYKNQILNVLNTSIEYNKRFHEIVLYTDSYTKSFLNENIQIILTDTSSYKFYDDFKLDIHSKLKENEILIDFDVFLNSPLSINFSDDIIIDKYEDVKYFYRYERSLRQLEQYSVVNKFKSLEVRKDQMPNIGIFKINSIELWEKYLSTYLEFRKELLNELKVEDNPVKYSAMLGQYTLNNLLLHYSPTIFFTGNSNNYVHLNTYEKYTTPLTELLGVFKQKQLL